MLAHLPHREGLGNLLVGFDTNDDAAVLRLQGDLAIAQTVDFFTPIVDDPYLFGSIAAANSISDIYAMGATPILGLAIAAFPTGKLPLETLEQILKGGADKAAEAGFPVAGGHTIIDDVPKYGLAVTGTVHADKLVRNSTARPGDALYLTKPLGNGILISAYRARSRRKWLPSRAAAPDLTEAIRWMTQLNQDAAAAMLTAGVSAATDITGYGFVGHLLEMCEGSNAGAEIRMADVPLLPGARELAVAGFRPAGTERNEGTFRGRVRSSLSRSEDYTLLCDAQTSGGLLIAVSSAREQALVDRFRESGLFYARVGSVTDERGIVALLP